MVRSSGVILLVACVLAGMAQSSTRVIDAVHFVPGALYTGTTCATPPGIPRAGCAFKFRASADGSTLRDVGITVIESWRCNGGGRSAQVVFHSGTAAYACHTNPVSLRAG